MIGLTKDEIKKEVIAWHNSKEAFHERSQLGFAVNYQNKEQRLGKTMDAIMNEILPSVLSYILEKNNQAIAKQLEEK